MDRFSADYIRQQPEYRYLVYKDSGHVIQTCVEDGEVKLRLGPHPPAATRNIVMLPHRAHRRSSTKSGTSSTASHFTVSHITTARAHSSATSDNSSIEDPDKERHHQRQVVDRGDFCSRSGETDYSLKHGSVCATDVGKEPAKDDGHNENKAHQRTNHSSQYIRSEAGAKPPTRREDIYSDNKTDGQAEFSDDVGYTGASDLRQRTDNIEKRPMTENTDAVNNTGAITRTSTDERIVTERVSNPSVGQTAVLSSDIGQRSVTGHKDHIPSVNGDKINVGFHPLTPIEEQSTTMRNKNGHMKTGGVTVLSADTESKHATGIEVYGNLADPVNEATRNDITNAEISCGSVTGQENPSHSVNIDGSNAPKTAGRSRGIPYIHGQTDGVKQNEEHISGQSDGIGFTLGQTLSPSTYFSVGNQEQFTNTVKDVNKVGEMDGTKYGHVYTDENPDMERIHKNGNAQSKNCNLQRNETTEMKVGSPRISRPVAKQQTSKANGDVRNKNRGSKFQKCKKKKEMATANSKFSRRKSNREVTRQKRGKQNGIISQQSRSVDLQPQTSDSHRGSALSTFSANVPLRGDCLTADVNKCQKEQVNRNSGCLSDKERQVTLSNTSGVLFHSESPPDNANGREKCTLSIDPSKQVTWSFDTLVTDGKTDANDSIMNRAMNQIDAAYCAASVNVGQNPRQDAQIDASEEDRYLMAGKACAEAERDLDSNSLHEYPRPVTRVDVIETQPQKNTTSKSDADHHVRNSKFSKTENGLSTHEEEINHEKTYHVKSSVITDAVKSSPLSTNVAGCHVAPDLREARLIQNGTKTVMKTHLAVSVSDTSPAESCPTRTHMTSSGTATDLPQRTEVISLADQGKGDDATLTCFTVPVIIVDEASTVGDDSDYSDDIDAVVIDAEQYLTFAQNVQSENHREASSTAQSYNHEGSVLNVPPNPELSWENMPSAPCVKSPQHVLRPGLDSNHRYSTTAALELSGLRTSLTPSTYNVEFNTQSVYGLRWPCEDTTTSHHNFRQSPSKPSTPATWHHASRHRHKPSTSGCVLPGRTPSSSARVPTSRRVALDDLSFRTPHTADGSHHSNLKPATTTNRRSSVSSLGTVPLYRQVSWEGNRPDPPVHRPVRRRHSTALGIRHEELVDMACLHFLQAGGSGLGSAPGSRRHSVCTADNDPLGERRLSTASALSAGPSPWDSTLLQEDVDGPELTRQASQYDPKVEKSERYNHPRENAFNKTCQWLSPVRRGLRTLQVQYTQTNTTHNDGLIFAHLLRAAHVKNAAVEEAVYNTERRLYTRRHGDAPHATTFFDVQPDHRHPSAAYTASTTSGTEAGREQKHTSRHGSSAARSSSSTAAGGVGGGGSKPGYRTVAKKKKERRERIHKKNEELEMGYTPRMQSLPQLGPEDIEAIRAQCRHLRVSPHLQQHLYTVGVQLGEYSTVTSLT
ncbi:uncharacterized protein LOC143281316 [Babylonia areolata]|uniref:uncharacterized protein LOC143281316 n=1 Tax=Babylonia areolata TaxID=304850 RepID=UPI003FD549D6